VLSPLLDEIRGVLGRLGLSDPRARFTGTVYDDPRWLDIQRAIFAHPGMCAVREHPSLLAAVEALLGEPPMTGRGDICRLVFPNTPMAQITPPHQDHWYLGGTTRLCTVWAPLVPVPFVRGPLRFLPGSHRTGLWPHAGPGAGRQGVSVLDDTEWYVHDFEVGDVAIFQSLTVHDALPNHDDQPRISVDFRYQPASEPVSLQRLDGSFIR